MITRRGFGPTWKPACRNAPPPLHVESGHGAHANWYPVRRETAGRGQAGPMLVIGGTGMPSLGVDPTDPSTWGERGYWPSPGLAPRFDAISQPWGDLATGDRST